MAATEENTAIGSRPVPAPGPWITWRGAIVLLGVGVAVPLSIAATWGALGVPHNDDWAYYRALFEFADHGSFDFQDWAGMSLAGQLVLFTPVARLSGNSVAAVQIATTFVGVVGLFALVAAGVGLGLTRRRALFVACVVALTPFWARLSVSYMTDVPAFSIGCVALALGVWALRETEVRGRLLAAALVTGFVAFTIREHYLVIPAATLLAYRIRINSAPPESPARKRFLVMVGLLGLGAAAFFGWRSGQAGNGNATAFAVPTELWSSVETACRDLVGIGLLASPVVLLRNPVLTVRRSWSADSRWTTSALVLAALVGLVALEPWGGFNAEVLVGNYLSPMGILGLSPMGPSRDDLIPPALFTALAVIGIVALCLAWLALIPSLIDVRRRRHPWVSMSSPVLVVGIAAATYTVGVVILCVFGAVMWDRYLLFSATLLALLVARALSSVTERRSIPATALVALGAFGVFGLVYATDSAAFDGSRWAFATSLTATVAPEDIGGGFEWQGWHGGAPTALLGDDYCIVIQHDVGQGSPDDHRWRTQSLTRATRLIALRIPDCSPTP